MYYQNVKYWYPEDVSEVWWWFDGILDTYWFQLIDWSDKVLMFKTIRCEDAVSAGAIASDIAFIFQVESFHKEDEYGYKQSGI